MDLKPTALYGELWIPVQAIKAPLIKPATYVDHGISGAWEFSDNTDDTIVSDMRIPYRMNRNIAPTFNIGWDAGGISAGNSKWQIEYLWRALNEDTTALAQAIEIVVTSSSAVASNGMVMSTINMQKPDEDDVCLHLRVKRLGADTADTIVGVTYLKGICMRFNLLDRER